MKHPPNRSLAWLLALTLCGAIGCGSDPPPAGPLGPEDLGGFDLATDSDDDEVDADDTQDAPDVAADAPDTETDSADCDCAAGEVCVRGACFARDCDGLECDAGQVCDDGLCVDRSCAGLDCGDYPNICRDGVCTTGSCESDPDVNCPVGLDCVDDECLRPCTEQDQCTPLACTTTHRPDAAGGLCDARGPRRGDAPGDADPSRAPAGRRPAPDLRDSADVLCAARCAG